MSGDLHPTKHSTAGWYHLAIAALYSIAIWWHLSGGLNHLKEHRRQRGSDK